MMRCEVSLPSKACPKASSALAASAAPLSTVCDRSVRMISLATFVAAVTVCRDLVSAIFVCSVCPRVCARKYLHHPCQRRFSLVNQPHRFLWPRQCDAKCQVFRHLGSQSDKDCHSCETVHGLRKSRYSRISRQICPFAIAA